MADLTEVRKQLKATLGYGMTSDVSNEIKNALTDDEAIKPLFDKYYDTMLKPMGVKPFKG